MPNIILHIKDSYYFEVPKSMWRSHHARVEDFPDWLVKLDDDFQSQEADKSIDELKHLGVSETHLSGLKKRWIEWKDSDHVNHTHSGWPLDAYLDAEVNQINARAKNWAQATRSQAQNPIDDYLASNSEKEPLAWFHRLVSDPQTNAKWQQVKASLDTSEAVDKYKAGADWPADKLALYNKALDGKILIPQPFGQLRNAYEPESGFCISKYMLIQLLVAVLLILALKWLGKMVSTGGAPKGKAWNAMEGILLFVRDKVITPAMGEHEAQRFLPLLWTFFVFIFGLNLVGMVPWLGAPTASLSTTSVFALIVFGLGVTLGVQTFGAMGFLKNVCPELGLPWYLAFWAVPMLWVIEFASLFIKHAILALRLLANMVAGHAVLLGIMGLAVGAHAIAMHSGLWFPLAGASAISMTALSVLELLIAFIQAAVFTFLAALFIGSSMHHH